MMKIDFSGFKEVSMLMDELPDNLRNRVMQASATAGAREIAKAVRKAAPVSDGKQSPASQKYGKLKRNIKVKRLRFTARDEKMARVDTGRAFWGLFLELGTRYIPAQPWMQPAFEQSAQAAINRMREFMLSKIEKEALKLAQRLGATK